MRDAERTSIKRAKQLRRHLTDAETILWSRLRCGLNGYRFRRQHPIGPYVADFACALRRLVIEVDGDTHSTDEQIEHDRRRALYLSGRDWTIFRVANEDVFKRLDTVLDGILLHMPEGRKQTP
jgi:very-short-patch-repair endonuclease